MKKTSKFKLRSTLKALVAALILIPAVISCEMPEDLTKNNADKNNAELEAKRLQKKIEIYNKMLGDWESTKGGIISKYHTYTDEDIAEVLHIQPTKWYWSKEGQEDVVIKTWDKPFYNYIYLFEEWNADDFSEKNIVDSRMKGQYADSWKDYQKDTVIYIYIKDFYKTNEREFLFNTKDLLTNLKAGGHTMKRSITSGNNDDDQGGNAGGNGGENFDFSGFWNYEVPGQPTAGGTITFDNGTIKFKRRVGTLTTEASYTLSGSEMTITFNSLSEKVKLTKNGNSLTIACKGINHTNSPCIMQSFFLCLNSDNKITLTKN